MGEKVIDVRLMKTAIKDIHNYEENEQIYDFYYDETNNYRVVKLTNVGFNDNKVLRSNFTLGGICIRKDRKTSLDEVMKKLALQNKQELKAKTFFKKRNVFSECICQPKLNVILEWILSNAYIHYTDIDALYYSVIDIVDSICDTETGMQILPLLGQAFKSKLYMLIRENIIAFLCLCAETNYPNIEAKDVEIFCSRIIQMIESSNGDTIEPHFTLETFRQLTKEKLRDKSGLIFLKDNPDKTIIESFYALRQQRCIFFSKSYHIFDNEFIDEAYMKKFSMSLEDGKTLRNFEFCDSKSRYELQISDIVVYLISKYLQFITYTSLEEVKKTIEGLNKFGLKNFQCFMKILVKSQKENLYFIEGIIPEQMHYYRCQMNDYIINLINKKLNKED